MSSGLDGPDDLAGDDGRSNPAQVRGSERPGSLALCRIAGATPELPGNADIGQGRDKNHRLSTELARWTMDCCQVRTEAIRNHRVMDTEWIGGRTHDSRPPAKKVLSGNELETLSVRELNRS